MPIRQLPNHLINQIAAGEVVERPASVVKELLENALDAGSTRIEIDIEQGGGKRIRIRDNGSGIPQDELALALSRHATSKIASLDDLEQVRSLGFRGEALPSIASVSHLILSSRHTDASQGWTLFGDGQEVFDAPAPVAHATGTTVDVVDLFFNTPARRKFLKKPGTEFGHIEEIVRRLALTHFDIRFVLEHNSSIKLNLPVADSGELRFQRVQQLLGRSFTENAYWVDADSVNMRLSGWLGHPSDARSHRGATGPLGADRLADGGPDGA